MVVLALCLVVSASDSPDSTIPHPGDQSSATTGNRRLASTDVTRAGILGDAAADAEGLVGGEVCRPLREGSREGLRLSPEKVNVLLKMACFGELWAAFLNTCGGQVVDT